MKNYLLIATTLTLTIVLSGLLATSAEAQHQQAHWPVSLNPEARALIGEGDELRVQQDFAGARARYEKAAEVIRRDGEFPATPLHQIAVSYYYEGRPMTATQHLDELAEQAADYGDLVTQVWALADCAWIFGKEGAKIDMERRIDQMRRLLKSPYLPYEVRAKVTSQRLGEVTTIESGT